MRARTTIERARRFVGRDPDGYRAQFVKLAERAQSLRRSGETAGRH
jgi:hypothetical protein